MNIEVDRIKVQEYHEFERSFSSATFDGDELARFLNGKKGELAGNWVVETKKRSSDSTDREDDAKVVIENPHVVRDSWLTTEKIIIDYNSILWMAKVGKHAISDQDEHKVDWGELQQCYGWLREFYHLKTAFFDKSNQFREAYLTTTEGVRVGCYMHEILHPQIWNALKQGTEGEYSERGLHAVLHPFGIRTKVNFGPNEKSLATLSQTKIKASIGRDDMDIAVLGHADYEDRVISFGSQMPYHAHVKVLKSLVRTMASLGSSSS